MEERESGLAREEERRTEPSIPGSDAAAGIGDATERMATLVSRFNEVARAEACVGPAHTANGRTVVPLATVSLGFGFGFGFGGGGGGTGEESGGGSGGGGGGGGRGSSRPVAVVDVSASGVRVEPVPDVTTLGLASMALVALFLIGRRGGRAAGAAEGVARRRLLGFLRRS